MPVRKRVGRKRKVNTFTREEYRCLFHGFIFYGHNRDIDTRSLWKSESLRSELAGAWQFLGPQVMREWLETEPRAGGLGGPGSRCAGWWCYESKERRRRLNGDHPFDREERRKRAAELQAINSGVGNFRSLLWGCPSDFIVPDDFTAIYESQAEYLTRLGLWLPGERELYEAAARHDDHRPNHPPTSIGGAS